MFARLYCAFLIWALLTVSVADITRAPMVAPPSEQRPGPFDDIPTGPPDGVMDEHAWIDGLTEVFGSGKFGQCKVC